MRRSCSASGSCNGRATPVLDLAPRVFDGAPRELREALVARRLDPERDQRREQVAAAIELPLADLAPQRAPQATLAPAAAVDPVLDVAHVRGRMLRVRRASDASSSRSTSSSRSAPDARWIVAQRAPHLVGVEAAEDRAPHFEQRARAPERHAEVVHRLVVGAVEQAWDRLAEPRVEGAELRHEKLAGHAGGRRERRPLVLIDPPARGSRSSPA